MQPLMIAIDDEPIILELLESSLADINLRIMTTADPELGLELIKQKSAAVCLARSGLSEPKRHAAA